MIEYSASQRKVALRDIVGDIVGARELIWRLCLRDIAGTYKQSVLGFVWAIAPPLAVVGIFVFLSSSRVLSIGNTTLAYPVYILLGLTVWGVFANVLQAITNSLTRAANLIHKMRFPREALVLAATGQALLDVGIRALLFVVVSVLLQTSFNPAVLLAPLAVAPLLLLAIGIGCVLAVVNALVRDVGSALGVALQFAMFLTPVVYPRPVRWPHSLINYLNPVSPFVIAAQDLATTGQLSMPLAWAGASVLGCVVFVAGLYVFRLAQPLIAERV